jgi:hypothetical protein
MIKIQMNVVVSCDNPNCREVVHFTDYFTLNPSKAEIINNFIYKQRYAGWFLNKELDKVYCSGYCEDSDTNS